MGPKQEQLDLSISRIIDGISKHDLRSKKNTLLLVAGDHGMTDAGNHGGSSKELQSRVTICQAWFEA
jgi:ethanolaminephosphotransferase